MSISASPDDLSSPPRERPDSAESADPRVPALTRRLHKRSSSRSSERTKAGDLFSTPETIFLGKNPIGGSTCEPTLENGGFEEVQLPLPGRAEN